MSIPILMKMMKFTSALVFLAMVCSCTSKKTEFRLSGTFKKLEGSVLTLKHEGKEYDRDTVKDGVFRLKAKLPAHEFITVFIAGTVPEGGTIWGKPASDWVGSREFFVERGASYKWMAKGHEDFFTKTDTVISTSKNQQDFDHLTWLKNKHWEKIAKKKAELALKGDLYLSKGDVANYKLCSDSIVLLSTNPPSVSNVINKFLDENPNSYTAIYTLATSRSLKKNLAFFQSVYARLEPTFKAHRYAKEYKVKADQMQKMLSNEKFKVDIYARDKKGRLFDLEDYLEYHLIYIDVWASWCMPCIGQIPAAKRITKELAKHEVAYVFLSIDEKATWKAWERLTASLNLKNSYLMDSTANQAFQTQLVVQTIPRYLIINTRGELLEKDAPGPDQPEKLKEVIKRLVRESK